MGRTVRQHDARTNITYVYEVIEAHYDPDKKQARSKRKNEKDAVIQQKSAENNLLSEKLKEAEKTLQRYKSAVKASEKIWAGLA